MLVLVPHNHDRVTKSNECHRMTVRASPYYFHKNIGI